MVAYNFQTRFSDAIRLGAKMHTIRRNGKRRHARVGESLQLYVGQRTRKCTKLISPDPICDGVYSVEIEITAESIDAVRVGGVAVESVDDFARSDGFDDADDMHRFWVSFHGEGTFFGSMIEWRVSNG